MEKIKEPQQSVKHGSPKPSALHKKRADEPCLNIHASRGSQRKGSRGEFLRFSEGLKLKQNAQHGTKWKPSHGRRARLHCSDEKEETTRQTKKIKKARFWKHFQVVPFQRHPRLLSPWQEPWVRWAPSRLKSDRKESEAGEPRVASKHV